MVAQSDLIDAPSLLGGELEAEYLEVRVDVRRDTKSRPNNDRTHFGIIQDPSRRHIAKVDPMYVGDFLERSQKELEI